MKHIKLYEEYTEDDIRSLMGNLHGIGLQNLEFEVEYQDFLTPQEIGREKKSAESWTSSLDPKIFLTSVSGEIDEEVVDLDFKFSNGDKANLDVYYMVGPHSFGTSKDHVIFTLNGREHNISVDKYMELLEHGSVVKAAMEIYDSLK